MRKPWFAILAMCVLVILPAFWPVDAAVGSCAWEEEAGELPAVYTHRKRSNFRGTYGRKAARMVDRALGWLARHQGADGTWDCDEFTHTCRGGKPCIGPGYEAYDLGVTGLAMLAFLGAGHTHESGIHKRIVRQGIEALLSKQLPDGSWRTGSDNFTYVHAICTQVVCEAYGMTSDSTLKLPAEKAVRFIGKCASAKGGWRYGVAPTDSDMSVNGWMLMALKAAKDVGIEVDDKAIAGGLRSVERLTDKSSGRVRYYDHPDLAGSVRPVGKEDAFPAEYSQALTAAGVLSRCLHGSSPKSDPLVQKGAILCAATPPASEPEKRDFYYWYWGATALYQLGDEYWEAWEADLLTTLGKLQRESPNCAKGSWDPDGAWGEEGGRVYSTAIIALTLEVYVRYPRLD